MLFRVLLCSALLFLGTQKSGFAQQPESNQSDKLDSLFSVWENTSLKDTVRMGAFIDYIQQGYTHTKPDSAAILADVLFKYATDIDEIKYIASAHNIKALSYINRFMIDSSISELNTEIAIREGLEVDKALAGAYINLGICYARTKDLDKAISSYQKGIEVCKEIGDTEFESNGLVNLGVLYMNQGYYSKSIPYFQRALNIATEVNNHDGIMGAHLNIGKAYKELGDHDLAAESFTTCIQLQETHDLQQGMSEARSFLGTLYLEQGEFDLAEKYFKEGLEIARQTQNIRVEAEILGNLGTLVNTRYKSESGLEYYQQAFAIHESIGNAHGAISNLNNISAVYLDQGKYSEALELQRQALEISQIIQDRDAEAGIYINMGNAYASVNDMENAALYANKGLSIAEELESITHTWHATSDLSMIYASQGKFKDALDMKIRAEATKDSIESLENRRAVIRREFKYEYEKQAFADSLAFAQKEAMNQLEIEKRDANLAKQRIGLAAAGGGIFLLILLAINIRNGKRRSDELLHNILPEETARELKQKGYAEARQFDSATVLFTDFKGFTRIAEHLSPHDVVEAINECFSAFDKIIEKYHIEKIKTIGDAYMAAGGLPVPDEHNAENVVMAALEMRDFIVELKKQKGEYGFEMRIGIHTGPVVAGIVGIKKFQYDIWGDTVNTAARMESSGGVGKVNISETTYELVKDKFNCIHRGKIEAKGKGEIDMYFVEPEA